MRVDFLNPTKSVESAPRERTRLAATLKVAILSLGIAGAVLFIYEGIYYAFPYQVSDFGVYYASAKVASQGGNPFVREAVAGELARLGVFSGPREYLYPSAFLVLIQPLLALPLQLAYQVFLAFSYVLLAGFIFLLWKSLKTEGGVRALPLALVALGTLSFTPLWSTLTINQNNLWVLIPLTASILLTLRHKDFWAGTALGLGVMLKVTPAFLFLYFLAHRRWRALGGALAIMAFFEIVSWVYFGRLLDVYLPGSLLDQSSTRLLEWTNLSLSGMLARAFGGSTISPSSALAAGLMALSYFLAASIAAAVLYVIWKRRKDGTLIDRLMFGWLVTTSLLLSPMVHGHHLLYLLIPLFSLASVLTITPYLAGPKNVGAQRAGSRLTISGHGPLLCLTLLGASFILIELDYWRIWLAFNFESWAWWAHSGTWGLLLLWGLQLAILLYPRELTGISFNAPELQQATGILGKQTV